MSVDDKNAIAKKIKKLLELSKSSNENEALSAVEKANDLMRKHSISSKDVEISQVVKHNIGNDLRLTKWKKIVLGGVQNCYSLTTIYSRGKVTLIGEELDVLLGYEIIMYLYSSIKRITKNNTENCSRRYKNQYREGLALGISKRLSETPKIWSSEEMKAKEKNNEDFIEKEYKKVRRTAPKVYGSKGLSNGMKDSSSISLSKQVFSTERKQLS